MQNNLENFKYNVFDSNIENKDRNGSMGKYNRKLQQNKRAGSYFVLIPPALIRGLGLKKGSELELEDRDGVIIIRPVGGGTREGSTVQAGR